MTASARPAVSANPFGALLAVKWTRPALAVKWTRPALAVKWTRPALAVKWTRPALAVKWTRPMPSAGPVWAAALTS